MVCIRLPAKRAIRGPSWQTISSGFTLLEILVVLLVVSVVISFATLSFHRKDTSLKDEGDRLTALLKLASEEAIFNGRDLAVEFTANSYSFLVLEITVEEEIEQKIWTPLAEDENEDLLRPRSMPEDISIELNTEGEGARLEELTTMDLEISLEEPTTSPRIYLLTSGEMTPFHIILHQKDNAEAYEIKSSPTGKLTTGRQLGDEET